MPAIREDLVGSTQNGRIDAKLRYTSTDPYAVTIEFHNNPAWTFARDLLITGMVLPAGEGDVLIRPVKEGVQITLRSPCGEAVIVFDHNELFDLLQKTLKIVPPGAESFDFDVEIAKAGIAGYPKGLAS
jgi:hypothetical protein